MSQKSSPPRMLFWLVLTVVLMISSLLFQSAAPGNLISVTLYKAHLLALGGWGGYWLDRALFPYSRPHQLIETYDTDSAARLAYEAYGQRAGGKTFDGKPLPTYDEIGADRQACWVAAVLELITDDQSSQKFDMASIRRAIIVAACLITVGLGA